MSGLNRRLRRARLRRFAEGTSSLFGCTCPKIDTKIVAANHIDIRHDLGCPAIVGRIYALVPSITGRCER